tara:strand:- start:1041 stop:1601 length:561 start_codon:yes stop_codon:yes gene_type:complete
MLLKLIIVILIVVLLYIFRQKENFTDTNITLIGSYNGDTANLYWYQEPKVDDETDFEITITPYTPPTTTSSDSTTTEAIQTPTITVQFDKNVNFYQKKIIIKENCNIMVKNDKGISNTITINTKEVASHDKNKHIDHKIQCYPDGSYGVISDCIPKNKFTSINMSHGFKTLKNTVNTLLRKNIILQ